MLRPNTEAPKTAVHREVTVGRTKSDAPSAKSTLGLAPSSTESSRRWFERAGRSLAGGISSSARATTCGDLNYPLYISRGQGSRIWDADGNQFIDYLLGYGSAILGHADAQIAETIARQARLGTMFGTCNTVEVELAEQIHRMVKSAELVRLANSGSEAICGAVRAARGFTGKNKVLKFEGHYHGWVDVLAVSNRPGEQDAGELESPQSVAHSRGTPGGVVSDVIICPWNSPEILKDILNRHQHELAAVVAEPIVANNACMMPQEGFLELLREECTRRGILLIFDEIVTGFRVAPGGAQELLGIPSDLTAFAKALGGGMPLAAFAGRKEFMAPVAANVVKHGGTYNGNPICAAAGLATLRNLAREDVQERLRGHGERLMEAIRRAGRDYRVPCVVQGLGSMFQVIFISGQPRHYRDLFAADTVRYGAFRQELLVRGIHANSSGLACWFVSAAHTHEDGDVAVRAIDEAMAAVA
ncbi:MAG: aspartate aminotransferase family protein [Tepidisphaeraceae bacterium]|jgi:glutamate-1-semialdehyde 2,1-aminomutase